MSHYIGTVVPVPDKIKLVTGRMVKDRVKGEVNSVFTWIQYIRWRFGCKYLTQLLKEQCITLWGFLGRQQGSEVP